MGAGAGAEVGITIAATVEAAGRAAELERFRRDWDCDRDRTLGCDLRLRGDGPGPGGGLAGSGSMGTSASDALSRYSHSQQDRDDSSRRETFLNRPSWKVRNVISSPKRSAHRLEARITAAFGRPIIAAIPMTSLQSRRPSLYFIVECSPLPREERDLPRDREVLRTLPP